MNLRNRPQTSEISFARMLHSSRSSGLPGVLCSWGGAKLSWPRHPCLRNYATFENVPEVLKLFPLECPARIASLAPRALGAVPQWKATRLPWPRHPEGPCREFPKEFRSDFRTPLESKPATITIISVTPKVQKKLKAPENALTLFELTSLE